MQEILQIASEIYMIVLCLVVGAGDQKETRIDQVSSRGLMDTVIAQRSDQGFTLYDERRGRRIEFMTLLRKEGKPGVFVAKGPDGEEETIDVSTVVENVGDLDSRQRSAQVLRVKGGSQIHVARSGSVTYLTESGSDRTYVIHSGDRLPARGMSSADEWTTKLYRLRYADAADVARIIGQNVLGPGAAAEVTVDARTRSVIVTASDELQEQAAQLIQQLDVEVLQP